eukprot:scaffold11574_cov132-Skeletonema_dohrnii-CCMP3373.AAC.2
MLDVDTQPSPFRASFQQPYQQNILIHICASFIVGSLLLSAITLLLEAIKDESSPHQAGNSRRTSASVEVD